MTTIGYYSSKHNTVVIIYESPPYDKRETCAAEGWDFRLIDMLFPSYNNLHFWRSTPAGERVLLQYSVALVWLKVNHTNGKCDNVYFALEWVSRTIWCENVKSFYWHNSSKRFHSLFKLFYIFPRLILWIKLKTYLFELRKLQFYYPKVLSKKSQKPLNIKASLRGCQPGIMLMCSLYNRFNSILWKIACRRCNEINVTWAEREVHKAVLLMINPLTPLWNAPYHKHHI